MRKVKNPSIDEYVLLAKYSDKGLRDPWEIGFLAEIVIDQFGKYFRVEGDSRRFRHCWRINSTEANERILNAKVIGDFHE